MPRLSKIGAAALAAFGWTGLQTVNASYLVVAGGGSGGGTSGGGGGAGGFLTSTASLNPSQSYTITVGAGGASVTSGRGNNGSDSSISVLGITATGGGGGGEFGGTTAGKSGGSGGGGAYQSGAGGAGTSGQGNAGGSGAAANTRSAGGGGGAGAAGSNGVGNVSGGNGGNGLSSSISGSSVTYAGGGGGSSETVGAGSGGTGGGGAGQFYGSSAAVAGTANTGGGGGGGYPTAGAGGSGIVIISYTGPQQFGGGVVTSSGGKTIHTFTTSGTLSPITPLTASYLIVAGGGGGACLGGGGGAGGMQTGSSLTIDTNSIYAINVGAGGIGGTNGVDPTAGSNSSFSLVTASIGGGKGGGNWNVGNNGGNGGSGGGGGNGYGAGLTGGTGTAGQGNNGGTVASTASPYYSGSGGGAGAAGSGAATPNNGGIGLQSSITGTSTYYAGGGAGTGWSVSGGTAGTGGSGGGGNGTSSSTGGSGTANTGGGGGASGYPGASIFSAGGNGGSGIVIISYPGSTPQMAGGTVTVAGGNVIHTFTSSGYLSPIVNVNNSLRFRSSASAYLNRTPASAGNRTTWTLSFWCKRGGLGGGGVRIFGAYTDANNYEEIWFPSSDTFQWYSWRTSGYGYNKITSAVYRDPSAWYHIVCTYDSTQATASNRQRIYINGVQVTAFSSSTDPSSSASSDINNNVAQAIGTLPVFLGSYFDGYLAEVNFIDDQALTPNSFGSFNGLGVWQPIRYGGSYGTNGFYLPFTNTTSTTTLVADSSPNGNNWTPNNISLTAGATYDSMTDVPTNTSATVANYAVMNPLDKDISRGTVDNGNLRLTYASFNSLNAAAVRSTLGTSTGKWYFECVNQTWNGGGNSGYMTITSNTGSLTGVSAFAGSLTNFIGVDATVFSNAVTFRTNGLSASLATGTTLFASYASGDVINFAFDLDAGKIWIGKNGTWYNSGNPSAGTNQTSTFTAGGVTFFSEFEAISSSDNSNQSSILPNFGQRPFSNTAPTGFVALNTFNLPTPTIGATPSSQANKYFDATTYTGNGTSLAVTNSGSMQPDFLWIKQRGGATSHVLQDSVRGAGESLFSNSTAVESGNSGDLVTSFNSNGFTVNDTYLGGSGGGGTNGNSGSYIAWQWRASNATGVTNTAGSITSTVSANTTAGFSIVAYTGNGTNGATVGHGLGVKPKLIIEKGRTSAYNWSVQGCGELWTPATSNLFLNTTAGLNSGGAVAAPTSTVFTPSIVAYANESGVTNIAYVFAEVAGYSRFGSYTGNGSSDGTFVYTGFRPAFIMVKRTDSSGFWTMLDDARSPFNVVDDALYANASNAESTPAQNVDFLSNGFKFRSTDSDTNSNGGNHIYMAFAESPFKYANAR